jgi:(E)-4-hydroxy-3-methylbut-2-enyl-diphosphate synthase
VLFIQVISHFFISRRVMKTPAFLLFVAFDGAKTRSVLFSCYNQSSMKPNKRLSFAIGNRLIGDGQSVLIQSMGDKKTTNVAYLTKMTDDLAKRGLDLMRFSVLDFTDAKALGEIKKRVSVPIIADIHFDARLALAAIAAGADKIRINPGNIGSESMLRNLIQTAKAKNIPIRIGVNSGSLCRYRGKTGSEVDDFLLAMDETLSVFEDEGFTSLVLSLKSSDPQLTEDLYRKAYSRYPYPLHLGVTESGFGTLGAIRSTIGLYPLLRDGIGDTLRVSLADDRRDEVRACKALLQESGRLSHVPQLIVCPGCGRTQVDLKPISRLLAEHLDFIRKDIIVACMGCPVNGIGEAQNADFGIAGSGKKDLYVLFAKGKSLGLYSKKQALAKLFALIDAAKD